jgi:hypothetical protein
MQGRRGVNAPLLGLRGGWYEAFPICRVADLPPGEKAPAVTQRILNADEIRALYGDGVRAAPMCPATQSCSAFSTPPSSTSSPA